MANTYVLISSNTVGVGGAASVTFSSIPSTYTDLQIVASARGTNTAAYQYALITFNSSTSGYSYKILEGNGAAGSSFGSASDTSLQANIGTGSTATASVFGNFSLYIPNYAGSSNKSASVDTVGENNATTAYMALEAGLLANTAAITSITLTGSTFPFVQYSTFYLYGISKS